MRQIGTRTEQEIETLGGPPKQPAKAAQFFRDEGRIYAVEAERLRAIAPPADVAADHKELIREDVAFARDYRRLAAAVDHPRRRRPPSVDALLGSIPRSFRVLSDYRAKGYDLGPFTGS